MNDITIVTIPRRFKGSSFHDAAQLPEALGRLKSVVEQAGFSCFTLDLSIKYFRKAFVRQDVFYEIEKWLVDCMKQPWIDKPLHEHTRKFWDDMLDYWCDEIAKSKPQWLGVSIFADECTKAAYDLCTRLRQKSPEIKIVLGGFAVQNGVGRRDNKGYRTGDLFRDKNLCDGFIVGEGDYALVEFLNGNLNYPGINAYNAKQIVDLTNLPFADYTDLNFNEYVLPNPDDLNKPYRPVIVITQSRGCPMPCTFCEVKYYHSRNANTKRLKVMLEHLIEWQEANNVQFEFSSMFIILSKEKFPEEMFPLLKRAGFYSCIYGVETGSQEVRDAMRKMYKEEDLYYTIDMCLKYGIEPGCMIIVGYPAETEADFQKTLDLLRHYAPTGRPEDAEMDDLKNGMFTITPMMIEVYSDVNQNPDEFGIQIDMTKEYDEWDSGYCTYRDAAKRALIAWKLLEELGYVVNDTERGIKNSGAEWEKIIQS